MEKHQLSKSTFIRGLQCLKSLYLYKNRYFLRDRLSAEQLAKFKRGTDVGIFAQNLFPDGVDCKPKSPSQYRKAVEKTADIVFNNKAEVIYEAAFQYDGVLILLDILVRNGNRWDAYEIKSSLSISETYLHDAALQYYVLTNAGVDIGNFFLTHLNPEYTHNGKPEMKELFSFVDVTEEVKSRKDFISRQIAAQKQAIALKSSPKIDIGPHCHNPYPCDFIGHCWKHIPEKSLFSLAAWSDTEKFDLYNKGLRKVDEITEEWVDSTHKQLELQVYKSGKDFFDEAAYMQLTRNIQPEICFISFLGYKKAIPVWKGYRPYNVVPVAFGVQKESDASQHIFVNRHGDMQPDDTFIHFLEAHLKGCQNLIVYDGEQFFTLLSEMQQRNPGKQDFLSEVLDKVVDYQELLKQLIYFSTQTGNDFSLANVSQKILQFASAAHISKEREIEAINIFLQVSKEPFNEQPKFFVHNSLQATARLFAYFESLKNK